ncbi:tape measure protein [Chromobacterium haemolyticum]|uniref:tape measure protein n=1 Tax=Chromobacterium TaxID=535 RepID=UPI0040561EF1
MDVATLVLHVDATRLREGERALDSLQHKGAQAERSLVGFADSATRQFARVQTAALSMVTAYAGINTATELIRVADSWSMIAARMEVVTGSTYRAVAAQRELYEMSQRTQTDFQSNAALFARTNQAMADMGKTYKDTVKLTQTVGQGLAIGGAGTQESSATMLQLSQALGSGVLQGDEFRSLMENAPYLMQKLADAIGVPKGELKKLSSESKLTSEVIASALLKASDQIAKDAEKIPQTASRGMQYLTNSFGQFIDEQNRATGASANLGSATKLLADNLDSVATAGELAIAAVGVRYAAGAAAAVQANMERYFSSVQVAKGDELASQAALRRAQSEKSAAMMQLDAARTGQERATSSMASAVADRERVALMASLAAGEARQVEQSGALASARARLAAAEDAANLATREHAAAEAARQGELIKTTASFERLARAEAAVASTSAEVVAASRAVALEQQRVAEANGRAIAMANALTMADERLAKAELTAAEAATVQTAAAGRAAEAAAAETVATNTLAAAKDRASISARALGAATNFANGAIALVGGGWGAAFLALGALVYYWDEVAAAAGNAAAQNELASQRIAKAQGKGDTNALREEVRKAEQFLVEMDQARKSGKKTIRGIAGAGDDLEVTVDPVKANKEYMAALARKNAAVKAYDEAKKQQLKGALDPWYSEDGDGNLAWQKGVGGKTALTKFLGDETYASKAEKKAAALKKNQDAYDRALAQAKTNEDKAKALAKYQANIAQIELMFKEREGGGKARAGLSRGESGIAGLEADIRSLTQMIDQYSQLGSAAQKLTEGEKQLNKLKAERYELATKTRAGLTERGLADRGKELADLDKQILLSQKKVSMEKTVKGLENYYSDVEKSQSGIRAAEAYLSRLDKIGVKVERLTEAEKELLDLRAERETLRAAPMPADKDESKARQQRLTALDAQIDQKQKLVSLEADGRRGLAVRKYSDELMRQIAVMGLGTTARERYLFSLQLEENQITATSEEYQQLMSLYDEHVAKSRDFVTGWDSAMADYLDSTTNNAKAAGAVFNAMTSSMEAGMVQFFETGKLGWKEFSVSVLREINKIMAAKAAAGLLSSAGGWLSSGAGGLMDFAAGMLGGGSTQPGSIIENGSLGPGRAFGGPVYPNTLHPVNERGMPELLMYGGSQFLMMPGQGGHVTPLMPATGGGGRPAEGGVSIEQTNIFHGDKQESQGNGAASFERMMAGLVQPMRAVAKQVIQAEMRPGGDIYRGMGRG